MNAPPKLPWQKTRGEKLLLAGVIVVSSFLVCAVLGFIVLQGAHISSWFSIGAYGMAPTLQKGDRVLMDGRAYRDAKPERGDILIYKTDGLFSSERPQIYVHRLVGLPGETLSLEDGELLANEEPVDLWNEAGEITYKAHPKCRYLTKNGDSIVVPADHYFVVGDNSEHSADSRMWGFLPAKNVIGKGTSRYRPPFSLSRLQ